MLAASNAVVGVGFGAPCRARDQRRKILAIAAFAVSMSGGGGSASTPGQTWRAFHGGDVKALGDLVPEEFIGISMNDGPFTNRAQTLDASRTFRERGGRLIHLTFPETQVQRFGDVVVLYGRYEVVILSGGTERTMRGRATEMFIRREGKWLHPGWHLDLTAGPAPSQPWVVASTRRFRRTKEEPHPASHRAHYGDGIGCGVGRRLIRPASPGE